MDSTIWRWKTSKRASMDITATTEAARTWFQFARYWVLKDAIPT